MLKLVNSELRNSLWQNNGQNNENAASSGKLMMLSFATILFNVATYIAIL